MKTRRKRRTRKLVISKNPKRKSGFSVSRRLGQAPEQTSSKKKKPNIIVILIIVLILIGLIWWKKDWILKLFKKTEAPGSVILVPGETKTIIKTQTVPEFPLQKGSKGEKVKQVQQFYNSVPTMVLPNKTKSPLIADGVWGPGMDAAFKKSGLPLSVSEDVFNKVKYAKTTNNANDPDLLAAVRLWLGI